MSFSVVCAYPPQPSYPPQPYYAPNNPQPPNQQSYMSNSIHQQPLVPNIPSPAPNDPRLSYYPPAASVFYGGPPQAYASNPYGAFGQQKRDCYRAQIQGVQLYNNKTNRITFKRPDSFVSFYAINHQGHGGWNQIHKTEIATNTCDPKWAPFFLSTRELCNNQLDSAFKISVWDWHQSGTHSLIGQAQTTLKDILEKKEVVISQPEFNRNTGLLQFLVFEKV